MDTNVKRERSLSVNRDKPLTIGEFLDLRDQLISEFKSILKSIKPKDERKWLKAFEVRKLLNISAGKLQYLRDRGTIPFTKLGGVTYYDVEKIEAMMEG